MDGNFFVFTTLGEMDLKAVLAECQADGWAPILVVRPNDPQGQVLIPCFTTREIAMKFAMRNLPKGQLFGTTILTPADVVKLRQEWVAGRKWKIEIMDHPRKMAAHGKLDVEVFELTDKPDVFKVQDRRCQQTKILSYAGDS